MDLGRPGTRTSVPREMPQWRAEPGRTGCGRPGITPRHPLPSVIFKAGERYQRGWQRGLLPRLFVQVPHLTHGGENGNCMAAGMQGGCNPPKRPDPALEGGSCCLDQSPAPPVRSPALTPGCPCGGRPHGGRPHTVPAAASKLRGHVPELGAVCFGPTETRHIHAA